MRVKSERASLMIQVRDNLSDSIQNMIQKKKAFTFAGIYAKPLDLLP